MKSFIVALAIVVSVVVLISVNAYFSAKVTDELLLSLDALREEQTVEAYDAFAEKWDRHLTYLSLTVARGNLQTAEAGLKLISFSLAEDSPSDFARGISQVECAIMEIADFSAFVFRDIL